MSWWVKLAVWLWGHKEEVIEEIEAISDPEPSVLGTPLPYAALEHQREQERAATSHKVIPAEAKKPGGAL